MLLDQLLFRLARRLVSFVGFYQTRVSLLLLSSIPHAWRLDPFLKKEFDGTVPAYERYSSIEGSDKLRSNHDKIDL